MSDNKSNSPNSEESEYEPGLPGVKKISKKTIDPQDLVTKGGYTGDPEEIITNPAVTPEMINEPSDVRDDLKRD